MDEKCIEVLENESGTEACDPDPAQEKTPAEPLNANETEEGGDGIANDASDDAEDLSLFEDPGQASDSDPAEDTRSCEEATLDELRLELTRLKAELKDRDEAMLRLGRECEEFCELYPKVPLSALPDGVWLDVQRGIPIAAAYALAERRKSILAERASMANLQNATRSSGALEAPAPDFFSPAEVRAMSQAEVRANYQKIMKSIQKWH